MHLTLGILRKSQAVSHALSFFRSDGFAVPAPAQVTQTVSPSLEIKVARGINPIMLDNLYNSNKVDYELSIPPTEVMELIAKNTENFDLFKQFVPLETKASVKFWGKFEDDDIFKISQKWSAKGYSNSYAPWLVGWVTPFKQGSVIRINFEIYQSVKNYDSISLFMLACFTLIMGWMFFSNLLHGSITSKDFIGLSVVIFMDLFFYGFRRAAFKLGQQDKKALLDFTEALFLPFMR